jgi:hypothetical protein
VNGDGASKPDCRITTGGGDARVRISPALSGSDQG